MHNFSGEKLKSSYINLNLILLTLISFHGCSTIEFVQEGREVYKVATSPASDKFIEISNSTPFYFWGLVPQKAVINLDKEFFLQGVKNPSMVKITRSTTFSSWLSMCMTLGLYMPEDYSISVYSKGELYR